MLKYEDIEAKKKEVLKLLPDMAPSFKAAEAVKKPCCRGGAVKTILVDKFTRAYAASDKKSDIVNLFGKDRKLRMNGATITMGDVEMGLTPATAPRVERGVMYEGAEAGRVRDGRTDYRRGMVRLYDELGEVLAGARTLESLTPSTVQAVKMRMDGLLQNKSRLDSLPERLKMADEAKQEFMNERIRELRETIRSVAPWISESTDP